MKKLILFLCISVVFSASTVLALPIIAIDANPSVSGIQSEFTANLGDSVSVDIIISSTEPTEPIDALMIDITYDPSILAPTSATAGTALSEFTLKGYNLFYGTDQIRLTAVDFDGVGAIVEGVLFSLTFDAVGIGESDLLFARLWDDVAAYDPFEATIAINGSTPVPEPATMLLLGSGLLGLAGLRRKFRK